MTIKKITRLSATPEGFGQTPDDLTSDMFISDLPVQHTHEYFHNEELGLYVGVWDTTDMVETAGPYPCDEFMWLLEGEAAIKNCKSGALAKVKAGEPFVIPAGYDCQWRQSGYLRKFFLISENPDEPVPVTPTVEGIVIPREDSKMSPLLKARPFLTESGFPVQLQHICYENGTGKFQAGTWESDPFESKPRPFPYNQFARIIAGTLTLIDEEGTDHHFEPGDSLFLPEGVMCGARAAEKVKLFFAIVKPT